ncbi:MAG: hypothetical protein HUJ72_00365 [Blautia sp.]|nr:hypothetical protein [Blautia sp.]
MRGRRLIFYFPFDLLKNPDLSYRYVVWIIILTIASFFAIRVPNITLESILWKKQSWRWSGLMQAALSLHQAEASAETQVLAAEAPVPAVPAPAEAVLAAAALAVAAAIGVAIMAGGGWVDPDGMDFQNVVMKAAKMIASNTNAGDAVFTEQREKTGVAASLFSQLPAEKGNPKRIHFAIVFGCK